MISKIHSKSRIGDVSPTTTSMLNDFKKRSFSDDAYMSMQIENLTINNDLLTEAIKEKAAHSILAPIDEKRDNNFQVIFYEVEAKIRWSNVAIRNAAAVVQIELEKYGLATINLAYALESAHINAMLKDLDKPKVKEAVAILPGLSDLIQELAVSQNEFEEAFLKLVDVKIEKEKLLSASKLRTVISLQINDELIVYLKAMALSKPEIYKDCATVIGKVIENNNQKVRNRLRNLGDDEDREDDKN